MTTVRARGEGAPVDRGMHGEATSSGFTTTLYALITALQDVVGADDDALVVATVVHLLRSGRCTVLGEVQT